MIETEKKWAEMEDVEENQSVGEYRKKWDEIEDDEEDTKNVSQYTNYKDGIKTVVKYTENMKKQKVKITKQIKEVIIRKRMTTEVAKRMKLKLFNIESQSSVTVEPTDVCNIEVPKTNPLDFLKDTEYDYLFTEASNKTTKDLKSRFKILKDEEVEEVKEDPNKLAAKKITYYRSNEAQNRECTVRVTNLSEEVNESELSALFGKVGQIVRMYLAKHKETQNSKGFAFITYSKREEAKKAIEKLNRHGFENLLLSVEWAKPSNK